MTLALDTNYRLRIQVDAENDPASAAYTLRGKLSTDSEYIEVPTSAAATVTFNAIGAAPAVNSTSSIAIAYPSVAADDLIIVGMASRLGSTAIDDEGFTIPTNGEAFVSTSEGTAGTEAADAGGVRATLLYKIATGTETGSVTFANAGTATLSKQGQMLAFRKSAGSTWDIAAVNGKDVAGGTGYSAAMGSDPGILPGDILLAVTAINSDTGTWSGQTITGTGLSTSLVAEHRDIGGTGGNDTRLIISEHSVSSALTSGVPTFAMTATGGTGEGATVLLRIRAVSAVPFMISPSANITNGEATTQQLSTPAGKTSGDFDPGVVEDTSNGATSTDLGNNGFSEFEFCVKFQAPATIGQFYDFRLFAGSSPLDTYAQPIQVEIGDGSPSGTTASGSTSTAASTSVGVAVRTRQAVSSSSTLESTSTGTALRTRQAVPAALATDAATSTGTVVQTTTRQAVGLAVTVDSTSVGAALRTRQSSGSTTTAVATSTGTSLPTRQSSGAVTTASSLMTAGVATVTRQAVPATHTTQDATSVGSAVQQRTASGAVVLEDAVGTGEAIAETTPWPYGNSEVGWVGSGGFTSPVVVGGRLQISTTGNYGLVLTNFDNTVPGGDVRWEVTLDRDRLIASDSADWYGLVIRASSNLGTFGIRGPFWQSGVNNVVANPLVPPRVGSASGFNTSDVVSTVVSPVPATWYDSGLHTIAVESYAGSNTVNIFLDGIHCFTAETSFAPHATGNFVGFAGDAGASGDTRDWETAELTLPAGGASANGAAATADSTSTGTAIVTRQAVAAVSTVDSTGVGVALRVRQAVGAAVTSATSVGVVVRTHVSSGATTNDDASATGSAIATRQAIGASTTDASSTGAAIRTRLTSGAPSTAASTSSGIAAPNAIMAVAGNTTTAAATSVGVAVRTRQATSGGAVTAASVMTGGVATITRQAVGSASTQPSTGYGDAAQVVRAVGEVTLDDAEPLGIARLIRTGQGGPSTGPSVAAGDAAVVRSALGTALLSPAVSEGVVAVWHVVEGDVLAASATSTGVVRIVISRTYYNGQEVSLYIGDRPVRGLFYFDP